MRRNTYVLHRLRIIKERLTKKSPAECGPFAGQALRARSTGSIDTRDGRSILDEGENAKGRSGRFQPRQFFLEGKPQLRALVLRQAIGHLRENGAVERRALGIACALRASERMRCSSSRTFSGSAWYSGVSKSSSDASAGSFPKRSPWREEAIVSLGLNFESRGIMGDAIGRYIKLNGVAGLVPLAIRRVSRIERYRDASGRARA
jgi:hypothetical protein